MAYNYLKPNTKADADNHISFFESIRFPLYFALSIWLIHILQLLLDIDLGWWGIYPREAFGLRGILFAPLLHADWRHLASNTVPFLVCAVLIIYFYPRVALRSFILIYFVTGFCVWMFARAGVFHIGLSYVVYGLVSFIFWTGVFRRSLRSVVLALIIVTLYSGMFTGILPTSEIVQRNISWESHLIGGIMGILVAYFFKEEVEEDEIETPSVSDSPKTYFLPRDAFDYTKEERRLAEEARKAREEEERRWQQGFPPFGNWTSDSTG
jgi:membrane associated rhomboid family serine protease